MVKEKASRIIALKKMKCMGVILTNVAQTLQEKYFKTVVSVFYK